MTFPWWLVALAILFLLREVWRWRQWQRFLVEGSDLATLELNSGHRLAYRQEGNGPDILLVHGLGSSMRCWQEVSKLLKDHYRVTAVDLLGFGRSPVRPGDVLSLEMQSAALEQMIRQLNMRAPVVVGCSMGGAIVLELGLLAGQADGVPLSGIIAMAPAVNPKEIPEVPKAYWWVRLMGWMGVGPLWMTAIKRHVTGRWFWPFGEDVRGSWTPYYDARAFSPLLDSLRWMRKQAGPQLLSRLNLPVLLLHGKRDPIISIATSESVARLLSQGQIRFHDGYHHLMEEDPHWVAEQIREFCEEAFSLSKNHNPDSQYVEKSVRKS